MGRSDRTLNTYSRTLREFFHEVFPEAAPDEVTVEDVEDYVGVLDAWDLAQNTKRRYLESLSAFYSWAMKRPGLRTSRATRWRSSSRNCRRSCGTGRTV